MTSVSNPNSYSMTPAAAERAVSGLLLVQPAVTWDGGALPGTAELERNVRTLQPATADWGLTAGTKISEKLHVTNCGDSSPQVRDRAIQYDLEVRRNYSFGLVVGCIIALGIVVTDLIEGVSVLTAVREFINAGVMP